MAVQYGLIGFPLGHSFSKRYFTEKFEREGIAAEYLNFELQEVGEIAEVIARHPELQGFNVTIPHKQSIMTLLEDISDEAREIGAVNCVRIDRTHEKIRLYGYNTDAYGFGDALRHFIPAGMKKALILGNGGGAKAVRHVLKSLQMEVVTVSRTPLHNDEIGYPEVGSFLPEFRLIVNTTPLGTWPHTDTFPDLPYSLLTPAHYLFDLVYNPEITAFMHYGVLRGAHATNGLTMLRSQARKAWEIWHQSRLSE